MRYLARISHTFSGQIAALLTEIAVQMGEDSVRATRPHPSEQQDRHAECASCQRKCEKSGLDMPLQPQLWPVKKTSKIR
jgi:tRNA A37 methylthiotransferase MiaB